MIIKNKKALTTSKLREQALDLIEAGISRVLPPYIMKSAVRYDATGGSLAINGDRYRLSGGRVFVVGGGKASGLMAETLEDIIHPENIVSPFTIQGFDIPTLVYMQSESGSEKIFTTRIRYIV